MTVRTIDCPGLDGQNPLGFFAALGLLRVLDEHARANEVERPALAFSATPPFTARVVFDATLAQVKAIVLADAAAQGASVALRLAYGGDGTLCSPDTTGATRDLKPLPSTARQFLKLAIEGGRRDSDLAAGMLSDVVQDNNGASKPTAFHFSAGQQAFLEMVEALRTGIDDAFLDEALVGPWRNTSKLPSLAWDSSVARLYALRASDPSGEKRGSTPAANWLAVHALAYFLVMPERSRTRTVLRTTNVGIGWKDVPFTWPLWSEPVESAVVASLMRLDSARRTQRERHALGISGVFRSRILRTDQGGYGSFTPSEVVPPLRGAGRARASRE
ncbi:MAG: type I-G CRISPR-associated protein, Cas3-extension family [Gemmatimonadales bacterium]